MHLPARFGCSTGDRTWGTNTHHSRGGHHVSGFLARPPPSICLGHSRTTRPSGVIQSFLILTALLDMPRLRTAWLVDSDYTVACLFTAVFCARVSVLALESIPKWKHATMAPESIPPEEREGVFGRTFFWWLMPLFIKGYRRDLSMDDLFAIDDELKGAALYDRLLASWKSGKEMGLLDFITKISPCFNFLSLPLTMPGLSPKLTRERSIASLQRFSGPFSLTSASPPSPV